MDDRTIIEMLRSHADGAGGDDTDVDALVNSAVVGGRRRRTRRRAGAALAAVVAAGLVVVLATGVVPTRLGSPQPDPAATPVLATPVLATPVPSPTTRATAAPRSSASPTAPATTGVVKASPGEVRDLTASLLPGSLTVTRSSAERDVGSDGFPWEYSAALTVHDAAGTSYLFVSIGNGSYGDGCDNLEDCTTATLPDGGIVWTTVSPPGDKAGLDRTFAYDRADGGHLSLMVRNYDEGNGPVTRTGLPLTDSEAKALVTSARWDSLFQG